jgi:hypothetical protein
MQWQKAASLPHVKRHPNFFHHLKGSIFFADRTQKIRTLGELRVASDEGVGSKKRCGDESSLWCKHSVTYEAGALPPPPPR